MCDEGLELLPFSAGSRAICVERDAESDAYLHEKVVVEQFKLLQPLFSTDLKQALISELVGSLMKKQFCEILSDSAPNRTSFGTS